MLYILAAKHSLFIPLESWLLLEAPKGWLVFTRSPINA